MSFSNSIKKWGFDPYFESLFASEAEKFPEISLIPARVVGEERGLYCLEAGRDSSCWADVTGKLRHSARSRADFPTVGDWVSCRLVPGPSGEPRGVIHSVLPRRTRIERTAAGETGELQLIAANVATVFIMTSANADLNIRRIERYLALVGSSGASSVVVLSKTDLCDDPQAMESQLRSKLPMWVPVLLLSSLTQRGLDALSEYMQPGTTSVLLGSSGVGKSTLTNLLLKSEVLETREVREHDDRGRHTTTARHLFLLENGAMLIDSPGMREIRLADHEEGVAATFEEFSTLEVQCRFTDCRHQNEPGCAVAAALDSGTLSGERLEAYRKLKRELEFEQRRGNKVLESQERKRWKQIHKEARVHMKRKKWEE